MSVFEEKKRKIKVLQLLQTMAVTMVFVCPLSSPRAQDVSKTLPSAVAESQVPASFSVDGDQTKKQSAIQSIDTDVSEDTVPAAPAEKKLVSAKPMGAQAQNAMSQSAGVTSSVGESQQGASIDVLAEYERESGNGALPNVAESQMSGLDDPLMDGSNAGMELDNEPQPEKSKEELQAEIRAEAFDAALTGMFPLDPDQIKTVINKQQEIDRAINQPGTPEPKPEISVMNVSLDPGVLPATIKTALGNVTTLNILDATGSPWPVQDVTWAGDFEVMEPEEGGHIIRITPMAKYAQGNLVVRLLTLKTPLTIRLQSGGDVVQYRVDARVPEMGPFAKAPLMQGGTALVAGGSDLTSILDGVMPSGMDKLKVSGVDGRTTAYAMGGMTYVRTPLTLLSPAWQSSVSSADGMNVYVLTSAPVVLLSDGGEFLRATISEKEVLLDE